MDESNQAVLASLENDPAGAYFLLEDLDRTRLAVMLELGAEGFVPED